MGKEEVKVVGTTSSKKEKKTNWKIVGAIVGIVVLALGVVAGIVLVRQNQDVREKAACVAQCPGSDGVLRDCSVGETDGTSNDSICNRAGRIEVCGQTVADAQQFCCPSAGGTWTTNLSLCPQPTATATSTSTSTSSSSPTATATSTSTSTSSSSPTATATSTSTSTSSSSPTATATSTSQTGSTSTPFPVPETGSSLPTILGMGMGLLIVVGSLLLAL